jgi:prophage antirepressor-like protein
MELINQLDETLSFNSRSVRLIGTFEEPWFVAKDICDVLTIKDVTMALAKIPEEWKGTKVIGTLGGNQSMRILNESGVYKLIMRSNKDIADKFQRWVCGEVLPSLRKKGEYKMKEDYLLKLKQLEDDRLKLEEEKSKLEESHEVKEKEIQHLKNKVYLKQKRKKYDDRYFIYMVQDEFHEKSRTYVIGKAIDLNSRLNTYNKSRQHNVVYYRTCNSAQQMALIERCILMKLNKYKEISNRDRFVLPETDVVSLFITVIDEFVNAFSDVDSAVDLDQDLTEEEVIENNKEKIDEYYEDNKELIKYNSKIYRENNKEKIAAYQSQYKLSNEEALKKLRSDYYEANKEAFAERSKRYRQEHSQELIQHHREYYQEHKEEMKAAKKEYYEEHKEDIIACSKEFYEEHKEEVLERSKEHYKNKREDILAYQNEKILCECGITTGRNNMSKHRKTAIHSISLEMRLKKESSETTSSETYVKPKLKCECGHEVTAGYMKRHLNSNIHRIALNKIK